MEKVSLPTLNEIKAAAKHLKKITVHTPLVLHSEKDLYLKPETLQPVKSFKLRGMYNTVASYTPTQREKGISTMSSGNTAIALGWTANQFGIPSKTLIPETTPASKIKKIKSYGTKVIALNGEKFMDWMNEKGWENESYNFVHPWHDRKFLAGTGTIGLEIIADLPDVETVFMPVGGGGLVAGVGNALKLLNPEVRVVGVESEACASLYASFEAGKGVQITVGDTICDGSNVPIITDEMYPLLRQVVDESVTVSEHAVKKVMKDLMLKHKLIVEGSAALALTAALQESYDDRGKSVCVITGGTIDTEKIVSILSDSDL